ncbi:MAG: hypothetical protein Q4B31_02520 [Clostridia bacterium]|nr:hypothetical protein [Clostridia bacterium]
MKKIISLIIVLVFSLSLLSSCGYKDTEITFTIPANSELDYYWAEAELSPGSEKLTFVTDETVPSTKISLTAVETESPMLYLPVTAEPNVEKSFDVEKGGWYEIGMMLENKTDKEVTYTLKVKNIKTR